MLLVISTHASTRHWEAREREGGGGVLWGLNATNTIVNTQLKTHMVSFNLTRAQTRSAIDFFFN